VDAVIVGLGNPGPEYVHTRHNAGFWCIDRLAELHRIRLSTKHQTCLLGEGEIEGKAVVLAKPRTFVNLSGEAARYLLARFGAKPDKLLIIYDDMDLPVGKTRLRPNGSPGGHNGLKSITAVLGTEDFPRLRIGIGRPSNGGNVDHVLGRLSPDEQKLADEAVERAAEAVAFLLAEGIAAAMNKYN
jgi:PTH1 family peptidyl-tRNA hydrolase